MINRRKTISTILSPISLGELIDKITILEIKKENMQGGQLDNVKKELIYLKKTFTDIGVVVDNNLINDLKTVNNKLWNIEDEIRFKESKKEFDKIFINLARSVYKENDRRALLKKEINTTYNSDIVEEKSYKKY
tara:strand:+ start:8910 stop:9311 length:402 start_codon:yes stop_codon:yes gene_type:complete